MKGYRCQVCGMLAKTEYEGRTITAHLDEETGLCMICGLEKIGNAPAYDRLMSAFFVKASDLGLDSTRIKLAMNAL